MRVLGWIAAGLAVVLVVASIGAYLKFRSVWDSIKRVSIAGLGPQPPKLTSATNILVIGSDSPGRPEQEVRRRMSPASAPTRSWSCTSRRANRA